MKRDSLIRIIASAFIIVSVFFSVFVAQNNYKKNLIREVKLNLKQDTQDYSVFIDRDISTYKNFIKALGDLLRNYEKIDLDQNRNDNCKYISEVFDNFNRSENMVTSIHYIDNKSGNGIACSGFVRMQDMPSDLRKQEWYIDASKGSQPFITDVYKDAGNGKKCITISYALYSNNTLQGVIAIDMLLDDIYSHYAGITKTNNLDTFILSPSSKLILHPNKKLLGMSFMKPEDDYYSIISNVKVSKSDIKKQYENIWTEITSKPSGEIYNKDFIGENLYGYFNNVNNLNWIIVSKANDEKINKQLNTNLILLHIIGGVICILLLIIVNFFIMRYYNMDTLTGFITRNKLLYDIKRKPIYLQSLSILIIYIKNYDSIKIEYGTEIADLMIKNYSEMIDNIFMGKGNVSRCKENEFAILFNPNNDNYIFNCVENSQPQLKFREFTIQENKIKIESNLALIKFNKEDIKEFSSKFQQVEGKIKDLKYEQETFVHSSVEKLINYEDEDTKKVRFLKKALEEGNVIPFFQPIMDIKSNNVKKYEVLMRIKDGENYLAPYPYIVLAEKYNFIEAIDLCVLEKAMIYKREVDKDDKLVFSLNISGKVLNNINYLKKATSIIEKYEIKPESIIFEITETENISNLENLIEIMNEFKKRGFKFSIDDFGTGFSSIKYLKSIPADYIKIDGSFIKDINVNHENLYLVKSMVNMARAFNLEIVAEFAENEKIFESIRGLDIDYAQGYYVGKPICKVCEPILSL